MLKRGILFEKEFFVKQTDISPSIPKGWTYLLHGSNSARWSADELGKDFTVSNPLCCVTKQDAELDKRRGFSGTAHTYSSSKGNPFQIRVLFFKNVIRSGSEECQQIKSELSSETIKDIEKYYSYQCWRHPAVPSKTKLIKIAETDYDEVYERGNQIIYWYVPEKYLETYKKLLGKKVQGIKKTLQVSSNMGVPRTILSYSRKQTGQ